MVVTLIITTYNWPEALRVTLQSVVSQTRVPDEVVIADDGSDTTTAEKAQAVLRPSRLEWRHVWHPDRGIRQARIKNLGVRYSAGEYLIFIDHDVVLHPEFIADHLSHAHRRLFLQGKRCFLPKGYTSKLLEDGLTERPSLFSGHIGNRKNAFRIPAVGKLLSRPRCFQTTLRGCNLSMFREDFLRVDGYDETFDHLWGREDSDICYRLFYSGIKVRNLWFSALQYHLYHEVIKKKEEDELDRELRIIIRQRRNRALKGFSKLTLEGQVIGASSG